MVKGEKKLYNPDLVCVFILLKPDERDEFYIFPLRALQQHCSKIYRSKGDSKGDSFPREVRRLKNPKSTHCAVKASDLQEYRVKEDGDWPLVTEHLKPVAGLGEQIGSANAD